MNSKPPRLTRKLTHQLICGLAAVSMAGPALAQAPAAPDPVRIMVKRLDLTKYKATIKALTVFGDRRQGTERNRAAIDWIEAQLKSYGCTNTERLKYTAPEEGEHRTAPASSPVPPGSEEPGRAVGGGRPRGFARPMGVNYDINKQPDAKVRALNAPPAVAGPREEVYCTKIGATHPEEMYIVGAHMDGIGFGEAANDDGSGTALVMELARIFSSPDVKTDRSVRFILWNNEESGTLGSRAYVAQRGPLQGIESPAASGRYPEPKWLGMIQHDMMLFDHGMPRADGSLSPVQRPEADVNIEYQDNSKFAKASQDLAWVFHAANERYATDYPTNVGRHMTNTDSGPFQDVVAAISLRENERGVHVGSGWDPNWHQATDMYATYDDKDFLLGLNAAQTTLSAVAGLVGATVGR
jgi:hypothetical protein